MLRKNGFFAVLRMTMSQIMFKVILNEVKNPQICSEFRQKWILRYAQNDEYCRKLN